MFLFMFTFIWAVGQASAVESLKTQNSNMYLELESHSDFLKQKHALALLRYAIMYASLHKSPT